MKNKKNVELEFIMDQLRKDKMILSLESLSVFFAAIAFQQIANMVFIRPAITVILAYSAALIFFVRMIVKNIKRKTHIRELEKKLYGKLIKEI